MLHENFDDLTVKEIQDRLLVFKENYQESRKQFVLGLYYLERTLRFRELKQYRNTAFDEYIRVVFGQTYNGYRCDLEAIVNYEEEWKKYGSWVYHGIKQKCGSTNIGQVYKQIDEKAASLKNPITPKQIKTIIKQNSKPQRQSAAKTRMEALEEENARLRAEIEELIEYRLAYNDLQERFVKLKAGYQRLATKLKAYHLGVMKPEVEVGLSAH